MDFGPQNRRPGEKDLAQGGGHPLAGGRERRFPRQLEVPVGAARLPGDGSPAWHRRPASAMRMGRRYPNGPMRAGATGYDRGRMDGPVAFPGTGNPRPAADGP